MNKRQELWKNTLILSIGQFVPSLISVVLLPVLTKYLTTEEYGTYDLALTIITLAIPCVSLQIQQASFRFLLKSEDLESRSKYITNTYVIIIAFLLLYPLIGFVLNRIYFSVGDSILICLLLLSNTLYRINGLIVRGVGGNTKYSLATVVYSVCYLLTGLIMLITMKMGLQGILIASIGSYFCAGIFLCASIRITRYLKIKYVSKEICREMLHYSVPIVPSSISLWIVNFSDRFIVTTFLGVGMNGIYSVANKIPHLYAKFYSVFNLAWTENASRVFDEGSPDEYYSSLFAQMLDILVGVVVGLMGCSYFIYRFMVDKDYWGGFGQVSILYVGILLSSLVSFYGSIFIAIGKTQSIGWTSALGALLNFLINLLLVRRIGLYAASVSTVIAYLAILIYRIIQIQKYVNMKYSGKKLLISLLALILCGWISSIYSIYSCAVTLVIAIFYNVIFNRYILTNLLRKRRPFRT